MTSAGFEEFQGVQVQKLKLCVCSESASFVSVLLLAVSLLSVAVANYSVS